jgi:hypothetical protein
MQLETKDGVLEVMLNFKPDAPDIQVPSATLPEQTADPETVETRKPDVPDDLPAPGGDGADEAAGTKKAELPPSMAA